MPRKKLSTSQWIEDYITFSVPIGSVTSVTVAQLTSRPTGASFRLLSASVEAVGAFKPTNASDGYSGYYIPAAVQIVGYSNEGAAISSPPRVLGPQPVSVSVRFQNSALWQSSSTANSFKILDISAICLGGSGGSSSTTAYVRGIATVRFAVGRERLSATCPSLPVESSESGGPTDFVYLAG